MPVKFLEETTLGASRAGVGDHVLPAKTEDQTDEQYKTALQAGIEDARAAGKSLYLSPPAIGADLRMAAKLYADVIKEDAQKNSANAIDIKISIFDQTADSNDQQFKKLLQDQLALNQAINMQPLPSPAPAASAQTGIKVKSSSDWPDIMADYLQQMKDKKPSLKPEDLAKRTASATQDNKLIFDSPQDATAFFKAQAEKGRSFLAVEVDGNNKPTGQMKFSCGTGKLYEGDTKEVHDALQEDFKAAQDPAEKAVLSKAIKEVEDAVLHGQVKAPAKDLTRDNAPERDEPGPEASGLSG